ncbi:hypothetical protein DERP_015032 [Dermatophagoides pteronyssinus]|uniref:Uncharacterized protein n=1 Tax=Dermatophagoides pteronyssinus TaxID=6956 RepID=A0ABQ8IZ07_DERPT|nr:hypothetical protein DERP_010366 [Dermatophagoides pteronyssinus]KAH9420446.1 hypothetical protein DERP_015032 [Dermatophagoides pteronyssinus]
MYVQANGNPVIGRKAKLSTHFSQRDNAIKHTLYKILPMIITCFIIIVYYHDFNYNPELANQDDCILQQQI